MHLYASDCDEEPWVNVRLGETGIRKDRSSHCGGSVPIFVDRDVELIVRGGRRHSRQEVDDGRQEIVGHWDWGWGGSERRDGRGSGKRSGEDALEGWPSGLGGDLSHCLKAPSAPTILKEKKTLGITEIRKTRVIKPPDLKWCRKTMVTSRYFPVSHAPRGKRWKVLRYRCEIGRNQLSFETKKTQSRASRVDGRVNRNAVRIGKDGPNGWQDTSG